MNNIWKLFKNLLFAVGAFFSQKDTPLWLMLALTLGGTYLIAPYINDNIQRESLRREFIVASLDGLNSGTIDLMTGVNAYIREGLPASRAADLSQKIVRIQFQIAQMNVALPRIRGSGLELMATLDALQVHIKTEGVASEEVSESLNSFTRSAFSMYELVIEDAGLL